MYRPSVNEWPTGLPTNAVIAFGPWASRTPAMSSAQRAKASGQVASRHVVPSRIIGVRSRSGSSCSLPSTVPLGHR